MWGADAMTKLHDAALMEAYDRNPVAAGPLKLTKHVAEELMAFERFDSYYDGERRVPVRSLDLRKVPEEATRAAALRAGEADIAPISVATRKQVEAGGGRVIFGQEATYLYIRHMGAWTVSPQDKKEYRQALAYAIDLKSMQNQLWGPEVFSPRGWNYVTPSALGYSPELDPFPYDPQKARDLLAAAGHPGGQGVPKFTLYTWPSRAVPNMPEAAQLVADAWNRELGLDVEVKVGDETALKRITNATDEAYGHMLLRENETSVESTSSFRSAYFTRDNPGRRHNDPEIFDQSEEAIAIFEPAARIKAWNELHRRLKDEAYELSVGYVNAPWGVGPRVVEWKPQPMAFYPSAYHTLVIK
jgi:peptide/nickel transport system substrate-binding protein